MSSYSRSHEQEADEASVQLLARTGYDPNGLAVALTNLERTIAALSDSAQTNRNSRFGFFDSHPTTPTRVADVERIAAGLDWRPARPIAKDRAAVYKRLDGLTWGPDNPMQGLFRGQQFMQADMNLSITFPDDWRTLNTPRYVGAFAPDERAVILFGAPDRPGGAEELATEFVNELAKAANIEPWEPATTKVGEWPAWVVKLDDTSGTEEVSVYYVWVNAERTVFKVLAVGPKAYLEPMRETGDSLRRLTEEELQSIVAHRIRIVNAAPEESLAELSARSENQIDVALTAAINGLAIDAPLATAEPVKIVRTEPYLGN
jgi:predicted Zn-dependent protease